jgi:hypothetical protein
MQHPKMAMENKEKLIYENPWSQAIVVKTEKMICASDDNEQFGRGNSYGDSDFD